MAQKAAALDVLAVTVNARFNEERKRLGLTQSVLGRLAGISQPQVSRFGRDRAMRIDNLLSLLHVCARRGMDLSYVFGGTRTRDVELFAETREIRRDLEELRSELRTKIGPGTGQKARKT